MYQQYINSVLFNYLDNFCTVYLNNILIYSKDPLEHTEHVCKVLAWLQRAGLQVDIWKCKFNVTCTKYLRFIISTNRLATFQSYINNSLRDLLDVICTAYLDNILIYLDNKAEHNVHVKQVVDQLCAAEL